MLLHSIWCATHNCYFIIKSNNWYFRCVALINSVARKNALYTVTLEHGMLDKFQYSFFGNVFSPLEFFFQLQLIIIPLPKNNHTILNDLSYSQNIYTHSSAQYQTISSSSQSLSHAYVTWTSQLGNIQMRCDEKLFPCCLVLWLSLKVLIFSKKKKIISHTNKFGIFLCEKKFKNYFSFSQFSHI